MRFLLLQVLAPGPFFSFTGVYLLPPLLGSLPPDRILFPQGMRLWIAALENRDTATAHPGLGYRSKRGIMDHWELRRAGIPVLGSKQGPTAPEGSQMWS